MAEVDTRQSASSDVTMEKGIVAVQLKCLIPMLSVANVEKSIAFYQDALDFDVLIGTATNPTIIRGHYADAEQVADAWNNPAGREHVDYFDNNRKSGIRTFQDAEIERRLANGSDE